MYNTGNTMKVETEIKKWGNSLALRVTGVMATLPEFKAGDRVIVDVTEEGFFVKPTVRKKTGSVFLILRTSCWLT